MTNIVAKLRRSGSWGFHVSFVDQRDITNNPHVCICDYMMVSVIRNFHENSNML